MVYTYKLCNRTPKKYLGKYCQYSGHMCNIFSDAAYLTVLVTIKIIKDNNKRCALQNSSAHFQDN